MGTDYNRKKFNSVSITIQNEYIMQLHLSDPSQTIPIAYDKHSICITYLELIAILTAIKVRSGPQVFISLVEHLALNTLDQFLLMFI